MAYRPTEATRRSAEAKRASMLATARGLVAESGFAGATVAAIAEGSGVSVGSVYSYFDNREALLAEVFREAAEYEFDQVRRAVDEIGDDPGKQLGTLIDVFADRALRGRRLAWSLLFEPVIPTVEAERLNLRQAYRDLGERIIAAGVAAGVFVDQDAPVVASAVMGAISEALVGALDPATAPLPHSDPEELVATIRRFCFLALGATTAG
ncbi:TetR/AcrR family transcriptional regulator [Gordonia neofelifaecis]|uniref:TetR family transcriptional regulator n=1 Tax=Gordonia neofelifaecis NRRL B-59395 TaxID=644548 RepID=F1YI83_9ACTN|nr:TetR/AcrR family transcriptional regulator [Gordonia neofelifaecis]EGD55637.1 TetR family transcriptional regulator [Gordonia neofelifaecis NRRL B-59395]